MAVSNKFVEIQQIKFDLFKAQNPETGKFDVEFEIGEKKLYAHKNMLNLISDTFDSMLSDRWKKNEDAPIKITNYSYDDFYQFITFLYSAQCILTSTNIYALVDMAEFYGVQILKSYCEGYLMDMEYELCDVFKLFELAIKYDLVQYKNYVKSIILVHGSNLLKMDSYADIKKSLAVEVVIVCGKQVKAEDLFQAVFKRSEKHVLEKQKSSNDPMFNLNNAIKSEICDFLPYINFAAMKQEFLLEFVVARGFIFQSYEQLSQILINAKKECNFTKNEFLTVKMTCNKTGFTAKIRSNDPAVDYIKSLKNIPEFFQEDFFGNFWKGNYCIPPTPSSIIKRNGVDRYLIYDSNGKFGIKHESRISASDYLIAEMFQSDLRCSSPRLLIEICE